MGCAGCDNCGDGLYQVHVTLGKHPGGTLAERLGVKVHVIVNLLPNGQWRKEWITTKNIEGSEREAVGHMKLTARQMAKAGVKRQKIEVPVKKLQGDRKVLYVEAHVKVILSLPNIERAIQEGRYVSVNAEKPGSMILTFRRERYKDLVAEIKAAGLERYLGFNPERPIQYEAAIHDDNPALDDDWIQQPWLTNSKPSPSPT
jgi:hypothetical protein